MCTTSPSYTPLLCLLPAPFIFKRMCSLDTGSEIKSKVPVFLISGGSQQFQFLRLSHLTRGLGLSYWHCCEVDVC